MTDSLYRGSAGYYALGRLPYPPELADAFPVDRAHRLLDGFEADLRALLREASPSGLFAERRRGIELDVWRAARQP